MAPVTSEDGVVTVVDLTERGAAVRRVLRGGGGLSCCDLSGGSGGSLVAGGGMAREGWCRAWRVLGRGTCSRDLFRRQDGANTANWR